MVSGRIRVMGHYAVIDRNDDNQGTDDDVLAGLAMRPVRTRSQLAEDFVQRQGWGAAQRAMVSGDWSGRCYIRLTDDIFDPPARIIFMDWPCPPTELTRFITIRDILNDLGLSVPRIEARDIDHGFMLIEDFGDETFGRLIDVGDARTADLYHGAVDVLIRIKQHFNPVMARGLTVYDAGLFAEQAGLFARDYLPAAGGQDTLEADFVDMYAKLLKKSLFEVPQTLILRDYTPDNLMLIPGSGASVRLADCGVLDFQDAGLGPVIYDLVSLLEDARRDTPTGLDCGALRARYYQALATASGGSSWTREMFDEVYAVLACQRLIRIIGVIGRQIQGAGNRRNLHMLPRLWRRLSGHLAHPAVAPLKEWLDAHVPDDVRAFGAEAA